GVPELVFAPERIREGRRRKPTIGEPPVGAPARGGASRSSPAGISSRVLASSCLAPMFNVVRSPPFRAGRAQGPTVGNAVPGCLGGVDAKEPPWALAARTSVVQ